MKYIDSYLTPTLSLKEREFIRLFAPSPQGEGEGDGG